MNGLDTVQPATDANKRPGQWKGAGWRIRVGSGLERTWEVGLGETRVVLRLYHLTILLGKSSGLAIQ